MHVTCSIYHSQNHITQPTSFIWELFALKKPVWRAYSSCTLWVDLCSFVLCSSHPFQVATVRKSDPNKVVLRWISTEKATKKTIQVTPSYTLDGYLHMHMHAFTHISTVVWHLVMDDMVFFILFQTTGVVPTVSHLFIVGIWCNWYHVKQMNLCYHNGILGEFVAARISLPMYAMWFTKVTCHKLFFLIKISDLSFTPFLCEKDPTTWTVTRRLTKLIVL